MADRRHTAVKLSKLGNLFARESPSAGRRRRPEHELGPATPHVEHEFAREHVGGPAVRVLPCRRGRARHRQRQLDRRARVVGPGLEGSVGLGDHRDEPGLALARAPAWVRAEAVAKLRRHHNVGRQTSRRCAARRRPRTGLVRRRRCTRPSFARRPARAHAASSARRRSRGGERATSGLIITRTRVRRGVSGRECRCDPRVEPSGSCVGRATRRLRAGSRRRRRVQKTPQCAALEVRHGRTIQRAERARHAGRISVDEFDERGPPHVSGHARAATSQPDRHPTLPRL